MKKVDKKTPEKSKMAKPVIKKEDKKAKNKVVKGVVVSTKMQKTVIVALQRKVAHKVYGKLIKKTKRFKADTNGMELSEGDIVRIEQTRPISKHKSFRVIEKEVSK